MSPEHQEAFNQMKGEIARAPILAYYDPRKETVLQTDASMKGLGACLLQEERPVYFASKALTETQRSYVAIEIESLAVGHGEVSSLHIRNRPEAIRSYLIKRHQPSNSMAAKNLNKNIFN